MLRNSLKPLLALLLFSTLACKTSRIDEAGVSHIVICWLKDQKPETREKFLAAVDSLKSIPQVISVSAGRKVESIEPVADNSFDVAFVINFKNKKDLDSYLTHPDHVKAVREILKPSLKKVIVYDFK